MSRPRKLAIAVTFFYRSERLAFLSQAAGSFPELAEEVAVWIVTDRNDESIHAEIREAVPIENLRVVSPSLLGHPYLLPWCHLSLFRGLFDTDDSYSHFLYLEDDLAISRNNIEYWMRAEQKLSPLGLIPGFMRFEERPDGARVSSDVYRVHNYHDMARVEGPDYAYVNFRYPYQGMYLMNRNMMAEFMAGSGSGPDHGPWKIRESATQGLIWRNVPPGCFSRSFVGYERGIGVDDAALIHHLPNNYANSPTKYGSLTLDSLVRENTLRVTPFMRDVGRMWSFRLPKARKLLMETLEP